ncbi:MAG: hypothetical protein Q8N57_04170 [bacterium]|nr:hypothetical protein [bacterium]
MPKFENYSEGEGKEETKRLFGNDKKTEGFSTHDFIPPDDLPNRTGLYGEADDLSEEDKIAEAIDGEIVGETDGTSINERELIAFGKKCDDYLNNKGKLPANLTEEEARKLALIYRESLGAENKNEKPKVLVKLRPRHTEFANLRRGRIAHATPDPAEKVQLDRKSYEEHKKRQVKMEKAA